MADKWQLIHPNHINAIVDGYEATIEHFRDRVGFTLDRRIPDSGDGALADYLGRYGQRIRSTVFRAASLAKVEKHLTGKGFDLIPGDADSALAINPAQNQNLLFEFTE